MPTGSYERYGLTGNPFRELASENLEDVMILHVNQAADEQLRTIREEVFDRENRAVVAITGPQGSGKTQRLLVTAAEAKERKAFVVYFDVPSRSEWVLRGVTAAFDKSAKSAGLVKMLGSPPWLRALTSIARTKSPAYDPKEAGRRIGEALNATVPSFLLLNDLHNMVESTEVETFAKTLEEVTAVMKPGVLLMFACYASYLAWLTVNQPALASRVNRAIPLATLSEDEARLLLAKKLLAKRIVEDLEPTYPFDRSAVAALNRGSHGNPRRLFELADAVLERAVAARAYQIDGDLVDSVVATRETAPPSPSPPPPSSAAERSVPAPESSKTAPTTRPARRSIWGRSR